MRYLQPKLKAFGRLTKGSHAPPTDSRRLRPFVNRAAVPRPVPERRLLSPLQGLAAPRATDDCCAADFGRKPLLSGECLCPVPAQRLSYLYVRYPRGYFLPRLKPRGLHGEAQGR